MVGGEIHLGSCPQFELGVSSERVEDELPGGHSEVASQRLLAAADHGDLMEASPHLYHTATLVKATKLIISVIF